jgi:hypothetical protein
MVPPPSAAPGAAKVLSLVKPASTLHRSDIEGLATALLDLASGYETALRTVISLQRLLERVRRSEEVSPESALLLQEMSRHVSALLECNDGMTTCLDTAGVRLSGLKGDHLE